MTQRELQSQLRDVRNEFNNSKGRYGEVKELTHRLEEMGVFSGEVKSVFETRMKELTTEMDKTKLQIRGLQKIITALQYGEKHV